MAATKTAQEILIDSMVAKVQSSGGAPPFAVSRPSAGVFRIQVFGTDLTYAREVAAGTYFAAGDKAVWTAVNATTYDVKISHLTIPGDRIRFQFKGRVTADFDVTASVPYDAEVLKGGFDHGTNTNVTPPAGASDRRLVVIETAAGHENSGRMFALPPDQATGIPIPTFSVRPALPAAGVTPGESVFVTATRQGYVWDGVGWRDITASPIMAFQNDTVLQANTTNPVGTYAVASNTGNMYVYTNDGWRRIGIVEFNSYADMIAWDAAIGTEAISRDLDVLFLRVEDGAGTESWIPISQLVRTEADILATQNVSGLTAVASDTGKRFVNNGTRWVQDPIEHYPTEAALLATTPIDGHLAWSDDTNVVFTAAGGIWHRLQGPQISVGGTQPALPGGGDQWFDTRDHQHVMKVWDGSRWAATSGATVGFNSAATLIPGYYNKTPSNTAASDDVGGIAFTYNAAKRTLWIKKGTTWNTVTPELFDTANERKFVVADAAGGMSWGNDSSGLEVRSISQYANTGGKNELLIPIKPTMRTMEVKLAVEIRDAQSHLDFQFMRGGVAINNHNLAQQQASTLYGSRAASTSNETSHRNNNSLGITWSNYDAWRLNPGHPYSDLVMRITRMYDNFVVINTEINCRTGDGEIAVVWNKYVIRGAEFNPMVDQLRLYARQSCRISYNGTVTSTHL